MSEHETPNPERRSDNAVLLLSVGMGMAILAWVLGVGSVFAALFSGGGPEAVVGGLFALLCLPILAIGGIILAMLGTVWIVVRVIADARDADSKERYRNVER